MPRPTDARSKSMRSGPDLSGQLREAIGKSDLSESEIARQAGIDPSQIHRFMTDQRDLRMSSAGVICSVLGLHLAEVARGRGRPKMSKTDRVGFSRMPLAEASEIACLDAETDQSSELDS